MAKVEPRVLKGFRDVLPPVMIPRQRMLERIEHTFQSFGFLPLMTPALEYLEVLAGKYGDEGESLLYRFKDQGDRDVALRYDLTVPLARVVAQYASEITLPFRRYQIAPVWRAEKPARGRFREFVQCDGDIVGSKDMAADAELVELARELLRRLGVERFKVRINNRRVLTGLMEKIGVPSGPAEMGVLRTIDKLPKIGQDETARLLREESGLGAEQIRTVFEFLDAKGDAAAVIEKLRLAFPEGSAGRRGTEELAAVLAILGPSALSDVELDLSIARGLNYYTGTIYEAFLTDLPGFGAILGGGRYDQLIGIFRGEEIPGVGISLGIDRLLEGLIELNVLREEKSVAPILVVVFEGMAPNAASVARLLREGGVACELFPGEAKLKKQFRHANDSGKRWVVVQGPEETAAGVVKVKDLETGVEEAVPLPGLVEYFASRGAVTGRP
jgi:histidyl-tRNA synthetase